MRVIAGKYGGRPIKTPKGLPVRPTTDRTREALFNILEQRLVWEETVVLDLFSGTGSVSLECWSRGAKSVISVDRNRKCVQAIKTLFKEFSLENGTVIQADVRQFLKTKNASFDLIFMDPPYDMPAQEDLIKLIKERKLLSPEGTFILEHRSQKDFSQVEGFEERRDYGSSSLSFFNFDELS